jgi:CubicO group peptidase (beta-lactamase class C family)
VSGTIDGVANDVRLPSALPFETGAPVSLTAVLERLRIPGVSLAVLAGGALESARSWGVRDSGSGEPLTPETLLQAGSISKPVAALCALRLVASGRVGLDADVNEALVTWKVPANLGWQPRVTLRQLLSHTAGLTVHGFPGYRRDERAPSLVDVLDGQGNTPEVRVSTMPGLQFSYSGGGYCVLQQLLVDLTGKPFPELARELVLDPLGMADSTYEQPLPEQLWGRAATGHRTGGRPVAGGWHVYPEEAAAGLWTTAVDLARFLAGVWEAAAGGADAILPFELAQELLQPQAANVPMGLGLRLEGAGRSLLFGHGGDDQGFVAWMGAYVESGAGAVVMTNSDDGRQLIPPLRDAIARAYASDDGSPAPEAPLAADPERFAGLYRLEDGRDLRIEADGGGLRLAAPGQDPLELFPIGPHEWAARAAKVRVLFVVDENGTADQLVVRQEAAYVEDVEARRVAD